MLHNFKQFLFKLTFLEIREDIVNVTLEGPGISYVGVVLILLAQC